MLRTNPWFTFSKQNSCNDCDRHVYVLGMGFSEWLCTLLGYFDYFLWRHCSEQQSQYGRSNKKRRSVSPKLPNTAAGLVSVGRTFRPISLPIIISHGRSVYLSYAHRIMLCRLNQSLLLSLISTFLHLGLNMLNMCKEPTTFWNKFIVQFLGIVSASRLVANPLLPLLFSFAWTDW